MWSSSQAERKSDLSSGDVKAGKSEEDVAPPVQETGESRAGSLEGDMAKLVMVLTLKPSRKQIYM